MTTEEKCVEAKKEANSMHEENDVSHRHMTWWRDAWWVRMDSVPTPTDGARPSKSVASSHKSRAGSARDRTDRRRRKGETGARDNGEKKATPYTLSFTFQPQQQLQQQQLQRQSRRCGFSDVDHWCPPSERAGLQERVALPVVNEKDFALVQPCKLQSFGEGSSQEHHSLLLG